MELSDRDFDRIVDAIERRDVTPPDLVTAFNHASGDNMPSPGLFAALVRYALRYRALTSRARADIVTTELTGRAPRDAHG
jgi:hypothetical protein